MGSFFSGGGSALISGMGSLFGGMMANSANAAQAKAQMDFQERMRNTQYQAAVKDLQAAGLNPMLAYSNGGAAVPSGSSAHIDNAIGPAVSNAVQAHQAIQATNTAKAQEVNVNADTQKKQADTAYVNQETIRSAAETALMPYRQGLLGAQAHAAQQHSTYEGALTDTQNITNSNLQRKIAAEIDNLAAMTKNNLAASQLHSVNSAINLQSLPGATNKAASDQTWWGRNVRPYLNDAGAVTSNARTAAQLLP